MKFFRDVYGDFLDDPLRRYRFARTARDILPDDEVLEVLGQAFMAIHERAARRAGKLRWADKAPENVIYIDQWDKLLGESWLLVHVVRNPLDTLSSMRDANFERIFPPELDQRIAFYRQYTEAGLTFETRHPDRYHRLVYEELVEAPEAVLDRLMTWLGEALEPGQLAFNAGPHQPGLEDPRVDETTRVHGESVARWRDNFTPGEAASVWAATSDLWERIDPGCRLWAPPEPQEGKPTEVS